jgi:hypothetical protein
MHKKTKYIIRHSQRRSLQGQTTSVGARGLGNAACVGPLWGTPPALPTRAPFCSPFPVLN